MNATEAQFYVRSMSHYYLEICTDDIGCNNRDMTDSETAGIFKA